MSTLGYQVMAIPGLPEITAGTALVPVIAAGCRAAGVPLADGDVVVVASKIVAKAQGLAQPAAHREALIAAATTHEVARRPRAAGGHTVVVRTATGPVLAAAGLDASDVPAGTVLPLPDDPDGAAEGLRQGFAAECGAAVGVLVADSASKPWRVGVMDYVLGCAGVRVLDDTRGRQDRHGNTLTITVRATGDALCAAADLARGKGSGHPVVVIRGLANVVQPPHQVNAGQSGSGQSSNSQSGAGQSSADLVRPLADDWFRFGHQEAVWAALAATGPMFPHVAAAGWFVTAVEQACGGGPRRPPVRVIWGPARAWVAVLGAPMAVGRAAERLAAAAWALDGESGALVELADGFRVAPATPTTP